MGPTTRTVKESGSGARLATEFASVFGFPLSVSKKGLKNLEIVTVCVGSHCLPGSNVSSMRRYRKCVTSGQTDLSRSMCEAVISFKLVRG